MSAFPLLSRTLSSEMFARLVAMLPAPADDRLEALIGRDAMAIAGIDALGPIRSAEEAALAITVVAVDSHAHAALRSAAQHAANLKTVMQCRAQALAMLRTRKHVVERLERLQAEYPIEPALDAAAASVTEEQPESSIAPPEPQTARAAPEAVTTATAPEAAPVMSHEERNRRRAVATAAYARLSGHAASGFTNINHDGVSHGLPHAAIVAASTLMGPSHDVMRRIMQ